MAGDITSNLIGHWPLNGNSVAEVGTNLTSFVGTVTYTEDTGAPWPEVAVFDGASARDTSGNFPALASTEELTYSCWFYKTVSDTASLLGNDDNNATGGMTVLITGAEVIRLRTYSGTFASDMGGVSLNAWQHLVITKSSGGSGVADFRTFLNGSLLATETNPTFSWNTNERFYVGCRTNSVNTSSSEFTGRMSDVRVYNRELSEDDVTALFEYDPFAEDSEGSETTVTSIANYAGKKIGINNDSFVKIEKTDNQIYQNVLIGSLYLSSIEEEGISEFVTIPQESAEELQENVIAGVPILSGRIDDSWFTIARPSGTSDADVEYFYKGNLLVAKRFGEYTYM